MRGKVLEVLVSAKDSDRRLYDVKPHDGAPTRRPKGPTVIDQMSGDEDSRWTAFVPDAARVIRAEEQFQDAVAKVLDRPFDTARHGDVLTAVAELGDAAPAARRVTELELQGGA